MHVARFQFQLLLWIPFTYSFEFSVSNKKPRVIEMAAKRVTSVKTLKKWQEEFKIKFGYGLWDGKVSRISCPLCSRWKPRIKTCKNVSVTWLRIYHEGQCEEEFRISAALSTKEWLRCRCIHGKCPEFSFRKKFLMAERR